MVLKHDIRKTHTSFDSQNIKNNYLNIFESIVEQALPVSDLAAISKHISERTSHRTAWRRLLAL